MVGRMVLDKNLSRFLVGVLVLSALVRISAAFFLGDTVQNLPGTYDQISYHTLALRVLDGHGFTFGEPWWPLTAPNQPTAHWSYLYTGYLVGVYALFGPHPLVARLIQALLVGLLQPYLAYLIGKRIFNPLVGVVAAALTALYAYFIYYAAALMTEPFYITSILACLYLAIVWSAAESRGNRVNHLGYGVLMGVLLAVTILLRQLFLFIAPVIFLWIWWVRRGRSGGSPVPGLMVAGILIVLAILPFTLFNYVRFGRFVLLNTNAGYAFYWANHPIYGTHFIPILPEEMGTYQSLVPQEIRHLDEAALDQELLKRGLQFIRDDPARYLLLSLSRIPAYFIFWPSSESGWISNLSRVGSFGLSLPFMLYGLFLSLSKKTWSLARWISSKLFLLLVFMIIYTLMHLLTWSLVRYRLPVDSVLLVFAAVGLVDIIQRIFPKYRTVLNVFTK